MKISMFLQIPFRENYNYKYFNLVRSCLKLTFNASRVFSIRSGLILHNLCGIFLSGFFNQMCSDSSQLVWYIPLGIFQSDLVWIFTTCVVCASRDLCKSLFRMPLGSFLTLFYPKIRWPFLSEIQLLDSYRRCNCKEKLLSGFQLEDSCCQNNYKMQLLFTLTWLGKIKITFDVWGFEVQL